MTVELEAEECLPTEYPDNVEDWLAYGVEKGWISRVFCGTHDGAPVSRAEADEFDQGFDPCVFEFRIWDNAERPAEVVGGRENY